MELANRLSLNAQIMAFKGKFANDQPEEQQAEEKAWSLLVEALAGLCAIYAILGSHENGKCLRGQRNNTEKAFLKSLRGYRVAFPEEMTSPGIQQALEIAADRCSEASALDLVNVTDQEREDVRQDLQSNILTALMEAAAATQM